MGRGQQVEGGKTYWPRKKGENKSHEGDEIVGTYQGLLEGSYKGDVKHEAVFETKDGEKIHIGSGTFVKVFADNLKVGQSYVVVFTGMKDTPNGEAFQFEVFEDDGQG